MYGIKKIYYPNGTVLRMQHRTYRMTKSWDYKERLHAYQNAATSYIHQKSVREYYLKKYDYKCPICGSKENLQIHHKKWVARCAQEETPLEVMNSEENLMVLCKKCHMPRREVDDR